MDDQHFSEGTTMKAVIVVDAKQLDKALQQLQQIIEAVKAKKK